MRMRRFASILFDLIMFGLAALLAAETVLFLRGTL